LSGGPLTKVRDGDIVSLDSVAGTLTVRVPDDVLAQRVTTPPVLAENGYGMGRDLFRVFRANAAPAEQGGGVCVPSSG
jgi:phosphogluconate dehydratase